MYLKFFGWEAWVETVPDWQPFYKLDSSRNEIVLSLLFVSLTVNRRIT